MNPSSILYSLLLLCFLMGCSQKQEKQTPIDREQDLAMSITKCSRLYIVQYNVRKIVTFNDITTIQKTIFSEKINIKIPGDRKIAIPVDATIKGYIDFSSFNKSNISIEGDAITITLPDPQMILTSSKIDHLSTKEYLSWYRTKFTEEEKEQYLKQGIASIMESMKETDIIERSRINAFNTLHPIIVAAGFKPGNIHISFRNEIEQNAHDDNTIFNMFKND